MDDHCCDHKTVAAYGVSQSMDEMNFQRGIWCAAMDGELSKVTKFLSSSINPNLTDSSGYTPLHYASRNGHHEVCEALLKGGADVDFQTRGGATALHRAAYMGHMSIVQLLLNHRANVMLQDGDGKTALHKAAERQHNEITRLLIDRNEDVTKVKDNKGTLALQDCII
ncbi:ankyrin repeat domain-containing protein 39-like isoform X2 [Dysidea avara]|uniref:ankyrin repeat domain-containing protein 39-like isoform X2 n=1 Tax=Dysidea avara TaxID=196820 RepID=UPI0033283EDD